MASYGIVANETTVQVLSPTVVLPIEYVTIRTQPSGVIASMGVSRETFDGGFAGVLLRDYANNIEFLMTQPHVIGAQGTQLLDVNGLIEDNVVFTVEYKPAGPVVTSVTAEAFVPSGLLNEGGDPAIERVLIAKAEAIIQGVYDNLAGLAAG
jgi:hypothetical protein